MKQRDETPKKRSFELRRDKNAKVKRSDSKINEFVFKNQQNMKKNKTQTLIYFSVLSVYVFTDAQLLVMSECKNIVITTMITLVFSPAQC